MPTHKAKCDRRDYRADFNEVQGSYVVPDGSTVNITTTFVWCRGCRTVRWGEELPELARLEADLAEAVARAPELMDWLECFVTRNSTLEQELARYEKCLRERLAWRRSRKSPPRCLACGATEIVALPRTEMEGGEGKWTLAAHPGCGGVITVLEQPVLSLNRGWVKYSAEGERLQAHVMSPSRGAVPIDEGRGKWWRRRYPPILGVRRGGEIG